MAHDLRTPLAALRGTLEGARDESDASVARSGVEAAIGEVDDLTALVGATLDSAEAEAGALRLRRAPLDLAALVRDVADLYQPAAADHELELIVAADEPVEIVGDAGLLRRVAINLFDNALAHLPAGAHVRVTVGADSGRAVLELRDDGPGFPVEIRGRAFERLVRGAGSSGRGLGLASVRAVAVAHGGRAALDHPAGGGSVVRVELPV